MKQKPPNRVAVFFVILFMTIISAPTVIMSFDTSTDISMFYSLSEEEESENIKLVIDNSFLELECFFVDVTVVESIGYTFKTYPKPHLNLVSPPPEFIL